MGESSYQPNWPTLLRRQEGAVSRAQLLARGLSRADYRAHLAAGRWQQPIPGIYVTFTGPLPIRTVYWVALLQAGTGAMLSHATAAALWQLAPEQTTEPVHITVPASRHPRSRKGLVIHRVDVLPRATGSPPRTRVSDTVLALCAQASRVAEVTAILGRVAQRYPRALTEATTVAASQRNLRWRKELLRAAQDVTGGAHSELERRYLVDVERAHGLPTGVRQRAVGRTRQDVHYEEFVTTVELDGRVVHQLSDAAWRDMVRDNSAAERGETTVRYGWQDVRYRPCAVAAQVAAVLRANGWSGRPRPCHPGCLVVGRP